MNVAQVRPLLPGTAGCVVLLTSRSRLSGLVAQHGAHRVSLGVLSEAQAIELLQGVTDGYRPLDDPAELRELAELCARLPLALLWVITSVDVDFTLTDGPPELVDALNAHADRCLRAVRRS